MKLSTVRYEESFGLEFTAEELYIINWALSDYMLLKQYSLTHRIEASPFVSEGQVLDRLNTERRKDIENSLKISENMKSVMELLVY
ncbi:MAG: hypothetical protein AB7F28_06040 [Candidatus Margulisiibacteriota bacterium]